MYVHATRKRTRKILLVIYGSVYMLPDRVSFRYEFILVAPDRKFCFGAKFGRTFHKYQVKEVRAYSGTKLGTSIVRADQHTNVFDMPMLFIALSFQYENVYVNVERSTRVVP